MNGKHGYNLRNRDSSSQVPVTQTPPSQSVLVGQRQSATLPPPGTSANAPRTAPKIPVGMPPPESGSTTVARMQRAFDRDSQRTTDGYSGSRRHVFTKRMEQTVAPDFRNSPRTMKDISTPYGSVNLSKFPTSDPAPKITTAKTNFKNFSVGHKYTELTQSLFPLVDKGGNQPQQDAGVARELLEAIRTDEPPAKRRRLIQEGAQSNAAAKLMTIATLSEPERVFGSSKFFRATLRGIEQQTLTPHNAFASDNPVFSMGVNPTLQRRQLNREHKKLTKPPSRPKGFTSFGGNMSDSSDDEL